jgi:hypothetical protein
MMSEERQDPELKSMAAEWVAPPPAADFHSRVLKAFDRGFGRIPWWRRWRAAFVPRTRKGLFAGTVVTAGVFFFVVTQTAPQILGLASPPARIPWTVDSEFVRYAADGSSSVEMHSRSYEVNSNEILLKRSLPGGTFMTLIGRGLDRALPAWSRLITPFAAHGDLAEKRKQAGAVGRSVGFITGCDAGCLLLEHYGWAKNSASSSGCIDGAVVGRETILNHPTAAVRQRWTEHGRMTLWMAPDLDCFALRVTYEEQLPDGSFRLASAKHAVRVNVNQ